MGQAQPSGGPTLSKMPPTPCQETRCHFAENSNAADGRAFDSREEEGDAPPSLKGEKPRPKAERESPQARKRLMVAFGEPLGIPKVAGPGRGFLTCGGTLGPEDLAGCAVTQP